MRIRIFSVSVPWQVALIIIILVPLAMVAQSFVGKGEWRVFESNDYYQRSANYPDKYSIEYPANWESKAYLGYHNRHDLRAAFHQTNPFANNHRSLEIYWFAQDALVMEDVVSWGEEIIIPAASLRPISPTMRTIGVGNYPTIKKEYMPLRRHNEYKAAYFVLVEDEAYLLEFSATENDQETQAVFERMLNSFEVYRREG